MIAAEQLCNAVEKPNQNVQNRFIEERKQNIKRNRHIIQCVAEAVLFCGRQCISLRGDKELCVEDMTNVGNTGNFLAALQMLTNHDDILQQHIYSVGLCNRNAKYTSTMVQNEIIQIIGQDIILKNLTTEIRLAKFYSIMADEVTSHNQENLALCIRFVDSKKDVREEFITFLRLPRITGDVISQTIIDTLDNISLDITNVRGQGYDGAANMSSDNVGVQRRIKDHSPKAVYVHCSGHCLNLVISHSCSLLNIRNAINKLKKCSLFFLGSPKHDGLLQSIILKELPESTRRKSLIDMCRTRWAARHGAYMHFYQSHMYIVAALECIAYSVNEERCGDSFKGAKWDAKSKTDASSLLASITSFDFIVSFLVFYQFLSHLSGVTVKLQGRSLDIIMAYKEIDQVKRTYRVIASDIDKEFSHIFQHGVRIASALNVEPSMPRIPGRQIHRSNTPATTTEEYYQRNIALPFIQHIISELEEQFSDLALLSASLLGLVPSVLCEEEPNNFRNLVDAYVDDLPSPETAHQELIRWKVKFQDTPKNDRPDSAVQAIKVCDEIMYPNIYELLKICCTIPATSCECERSASELRRLHTYNRATQERLSALALIHIHYSTDIIMEEVVELFAKKHQRRLELSFLLTD